MHKAKQAAPAGLQLLVKLYPKRDDESKQKSQYEPARFDNCLGKLQVLLKEVYHLTKFLSNANFNHC